MKTSQTSEPDGASRGPSPVWIAVAVIALLVVGLLAYSVIDQPSESLQVGGPVPAFELTALDGRPMELDGPPGQVIVLNFFASWCEPCRQEAADLEATWQEYQGQDVQFLGIAYKDADSRAQAFLDEFGVTYPSAVDAGNRTARAYGVTGVPETFIVDRNGLLVQHFLGAVTRSALSTGIDGALQR